MNRKEEMEMADRLDCYAGNFDSDHAEQVVKDLRSAAAALRASAAPEEVFNVERLQRLISEKLAQLRHYKENCQLDHARAVAEGRIQQAEQIGHWIADRSPSPSVGTPEMTSAHREAPHG